VEGYAVAFASRTICVERGPAFAFRKFNSALLPENRNGGIHPIEALAAHAACVL
jgi:hypothetical protein